MSEARAVPFYCPFCGEQEIRPADPPEGRLQDRGGAVAEHARIVGGHGAAARPVDAHRRQR